MSQRSTSSAQRSSGGVNAAGNPNDTCVVIGGDGQKKILTITWSYGANGGGVPAASLPLYGRLLVIAGVDASGYQASGNLPTGVMADGGMNGIGAFGGRIVFDVDIQASAGSVGQQVVFPDNGNEGWVGTTNGPLTIILTAPVTSSSGLVTNIVGKLTVQYDMSYAKTPADGAPGYAYTPISGAAS